MSSIFGAPPDAYQQWYSQNRPQPLGPYPSAPGGGGVIGGGGGVIGGGGGGVIGGGGGGVIGGGQLHPNPDVHNLIAQFHGALNGLAAHPAFGAPGQLGQGGPMLADIAPGIVGGPFPNPGTPPNGIGGGPFHGAPSTGDVIHSSPGGSAIGGSPGPGYGVLQGILGGGLSYA